MATSTAQFLKKLVEIRNIAVFVCAPFCKSGQKLKPGYILAEAGFVKTAGYWLEPEPKSGASLLVAPSALCLISGLPLQMLLLVMLSA